MRGIQVDSQRFRQLRRARGLTQQDLASLAGVGERTVRNAETGRRVRLDFLRFLAAALGIDVVEVVDDRDEIRVALREHRRVEHIVAALECHVSGSPDELLALMTRDVLYVMPGPTEIPICGEYRGPDGFWRLIDRSVASVAYESKLEISDIRTGGNLVVMRGVDRLRALPTGKSFSTPWMNVYEFDNGHIVRVDSWGDMSIIAQAFQPG